MLHFPSSGLMPLDSLLLGSISLVACFSAIFEKEKEKPGKTAPAESPSYRLDILILSCNDSTWHRGVFAPSLCSARRPRTETPRFHSLCKGEQTARPSLLHEL